MMRLAFEPLGGLFMVRIGRLTDYGVAILALFVRQPTDSQLAASEISEKTRLPLPSVMKLLKLFCKAGYLSSQRGVTGGYSLQRPPHRISLAEIVETLEGPIAITLCSSRQTSDCCDRKRHCSQYGKWRKVSQTIRSSLQALSLADIA